jgi:REP element-mobilizing transposase RayT
MIPTTIRVPQGFRVIRPDKPLRIYKRNLPHWRQDGATYFVTFRQQDSIPAHIWQAMEEELRHWRQRAEEEELRNGGTLPDAFMRDWEAFQRRHMTKLERELDACQGSCLLRSNRNREIMAGALRHFDGDRHVLHAFVIMPNHVHLAVTPHAGWELEDLLQSWKGFSAREINKAIGGTGALWQGESYDRIIRDEPHFEKAVRYIAKNPGSSQRSRSQSTLWFEAGLVEGDEGGLVREDGEDYGEECGLW